MRGVSVIFDRSTPEGELYICRKAQRRQITGRKNTNFRQGLAFTVYTIAHYIENSKIT